MQRRESKLAFLGSSEQERFQAILDTAKEQCRERYLDEYSWRASISKLVAEKYGCSEKKHLVYAFLNTIGSQNLTLLRNVCLGEAASERVRDKQRFRGQKSCKSADTFGQNKLAEISGSLVRIAASLPDDARTLRGVCEASGKKLFMVKSLAYQNAEFRKMLKDGIEALAYQKG